MLSLNDSTFFHKILTLENGHGSTEPKSYSDLKICYVENGTAGWLIDGREYTVSTGDIVFLQEHQERCFTAINSPSFSLVVLTLKRQALYSTDYLSCFFSIANRSQRIIRDDDFLRLLKQITDEYTKKKRNFYDMISALLTTLFVLAQRQFGCKTDDFTAMDQNMVAVLDYIDTGFKNQISLAQMAHLAKMTDSSFSRWFKKSNGISFKKYLMSRRIEYAVSLLEKSEMNAVDIAYECGFSSVSGFYDTFKKITGTTPNKVQSIL